LVEANLILLRLTLVAMAMTFVEFGQKFLVMVVVMFKSLRLAVFETCIHSRW